ncbi:uncharacterized protein LOC133906776 [Phragmites australis]|uniref:uncharacterized protein LOC133906776 n=1 Tax=Phragmites australis TaxID=29695 RepID=UPI002D79221E|nr:uncharacterized protein LOC133906776 [Phragmites australis]
MPASLPLATVLLLLAASAAATGDGYSGRMVIIDAPGTRVAGARDGKWPRRLENDVAPEFPAAGSLQGADGGHISTGALQKDKPVCLSGNQCATQARGGSYTRPCTYQGQCPQ